MSPMRTDDLHRCEASRRGRALQRLAAGGLACVLLALPTAARAQTPTVPLELSAISGDGATMISDDGTMKLTWNAATNANALPAKIAETSQAHS